MSGVVAAVVAAAATIVFWQVAAVTAHGRGTVLAPMPPALPVVVAATTCAGVLLGSTTAGAVVPLAGVAVAGVLDARTGAIFDPLNLAIFLAAAGTSIAAGSFVAGSLGASAVGGSLGTLYLLTRGNGIGLGDVKLGAGVGMALGCTLGLAAIGVAFILGAAYACWLLAGKRASRRSAIAFGPFIAAGMFAAAIVPPVSLP